MKQHKIWPKQNHQNVSKQCGHVNSLDLTSDTSLKMNQYIKPNQKQNEAYENTLNTNHIKEIKQKNTQVHPMITRSKIRTMSQDEADKYMGMQLMVSKQRKSFASNKKENDLPKNQSVDKTGHLNDMLSEIHSSLEENKENGEFHTVGLPGETVIICTGTVSTVVVRTGRWWQNFRNLMFWS